MSKTYYKYQERGFENQIDWTAIGKSMTDMLADQMQKREGKKQEIDKASREYVETLNTPPSGQFLDGNAALLKYSNEAREYHLMQHRLLKSGLLDPGQYVVNRENNESSTKSIFEVGKKFQEKYADRLKRWENKESSDIERKAMEAGENFTQWKNSEFRINPETGAVSVSILGDPDENGIRPAKQTMTVQQFGNLVSHDYNRFKSDEWFTGKEESVGSFVTLQEKLTGKERTLEWIETISDKTKRDDGIGKAWQDYVDATYKELLVNPNDAASILTDTMGGYEAVLSEEDAIGEDGKRDQSKVVYKNDGYGVWRAELTEEQQASLKEYVDLQLTARVDKEIKASGVSRVPQKSRSGGGGGGTKGERNAKTVGQKLSSHIGKLYYGGDRQKQMAADAIRSLSGGEIRAINVEGDNLFIEYSDPRRDAETIPISTLSEEEFVESTWNFLMPEEFNATKALDFYELTGGSFTQGFADSRGAARESVNDAYARYIDEEGGIVPDVFIEDGEKKTKQNIERVLASLPGMKGYTVEQAGAGMRNWGGIDRVIIKNPNGKEVARFELDDLNTSKIEEHVEKLKSLANNAVGPKTKKDVVGDDLQFKTKKSTPNKKEGRAAKYNKQ